MASSNIDLIYCGQYTHKNEGSIEPGPCNFCQTPHPKRKAVVVSVPTSELPAKSVCICQPACSLGSIIDLSAPDAVQAVASAASLAKAVSICQSAPCSSGSVIDLFAPDAAQAVASALPAKPVCIDQPVLDPDGALASASTLPAKPVFGLSSSIVIDIAGIDVVKENRVLADQNHTLAIVVGQMSHER